MWIFVFGSNLSGIHGAGAARDALNEHGAIWGQGIGLQGQSYAIPTKDENIETLPLERIEEYVYDFIDFAEKHPEMTFEVTRIGCGLAGYTNEDIAPMFASAPSNCVLHKDWDAIIDGMNSKMFSRLIADENDIPPYQEEGES